MGTKSDENDNEPEGQMSKIEIGSSIKIHFAYKEEA